MSDTRTSETLDEKLWRERSDELLAQRPSKGLLASALGKLPNERHTLLHSEACAILAEIQRLGRELSQLQSLAGSALTQLDAKVSADVATGGRNDG